MRGLRLAKGCVTYPSSQIVLDEGESVYVIQCMPGYVIYIAGFTEICMSICLILEFKKITSFV